MAWLRLIRWKNLLIIFLTQLIAWVCVIAEHRDKLVSYSLNTINFFYLSLSTVLIAAAGYIINDYFDVRIDAINKPDKVILEKSIPRRLAIILHSVLNVAAIMLAAVVARRAHHYEWLLMQLLCTLLLWFYSTHFKRQFMVGNVVVALLASFTVIVLLVYDPALYQYAISYGPMIDNSNGTHIPNPAWVLIIYAYFAFILTWMREIVKDMEDFKGDAEEGCVTMPIKWGLLRSVRFTQVLGLLVIVPLLLGGIRLCLAHWWLLGSYAIVALVIPIIVWMVYLPREATQAHYHTASQRLKIMMVFGIISLVVYFFEAYA